MQLLMCPPDYYGIEYEINPWMNRSRRSDLQLANEQWNALRRVLQERCAVDIHVIDAEPGLPDMVFTANAGLVCGDSWLAGYHIRSDIGAHQKIAEIIEQQILSLELASEWFYHLDTCFCPLSDKQALFYAPAFDPYACRVIENHIPHLIAVSPAEAARFACNAIVVDKCVVMNDGCPQVHEQLEGIGFTVFETPLSEFLKAGGSAKCLALIIQ